MPAERSRDATYEKPVEVISGWAMLFISLALMIGAVVFVFVGPGFPPFRLLGAVFFEVLMIGLLTGLFALQPNEARVLILFGHYKGTVRKSGFHWANPFYARNRGKIPWGVAPPQDPKTGTRIGPGASGIIYKPLKATISLRARNFNSDKLKVNDKRGNPVEIAAVIVWRVVQSESAIRYIASAYAYDYGEEDEVTLRGGGDEISHELKKELETRLAKAGCVVDEARLTHLAYAPEIAHAMLRRQQAEAVIAARQKIVLGAVSMVDMALRELDVKQVVKLDEERKAAMVSNLLVVLCGTAEAAPVINTGTLYS
jgi:hypothetical protein